MVFESNFITGAYFIWIGAIFDFLDGLSARSLDAYSDTGKELDSMADLVTFGVLPSMILYRFLSVSFPVGSLWPYISCLTPLFSALRLAKFNIDVNQKDVFIGLPTPANAFLLSGLPFLATVPFFHFVSSPVFLVSSVILSSLLMVSPFQFISIKFKSLVIKENIFRYMIVLSGLFFISILRSEGITLAILSYILISFVHNLPNHSARSFSEEK
jgi:CDP-diacylglycerol--serine O-phosphatidyltransferase